MIVEGLTELGTRLYAIRKSCRMTQAQVAEAAGLSNNTYAEIERGVVNASISSLLQICRALHITPNEILVADDHAATAREEEILARLRTCSPHEKETALKLLETYLASLR